MDERSPLLSEYPGAGSTRTASVLVGAELGDHHSQFCHLVGVRPLNHPDDEAHKPHPESLYRRAVKHRNFQSNTYIFTATLVNSLLLGQVVLGAALTGLAASGMNRGVVTVFGALNTIIAGVIAFLKSRGQPMRARMFRDDLGRVVDEIENSAVMWYGISRGAHGYDAIDTDAQVTVRSEVARLTRLYDKAVKTNTINNPDLYSAGIGSMDSLTAGLRKDATASGNVPVAAIAPTLPVAGLPPVAAPAPVAADPDDSPASAAGPAKKKEDDKPKDEPTKAAEPEPTKQDDAAPASETDDKAKDSTPTPAPVSKAAPAPAPAPTPAPPPSDPDASPATAATFPRKEDSHLSSTDTIVGDLKA